MLVSDAAAAGVNLWHIQHTSWETTDIRSSPTWLISHRRKKKLLLEEYGHFKVMQCVKKINKVRNWCPGPGSGVGLVPRSSYIFLAQPGEAFWAISLKKWQTAVGGMRLSVLADCKRLGGWDIYLPPLQEHQAHRKTEAAGRLHRRRPPDRLH